MWIEIGEISCERAKNVDPSGPCVGVFDLRFFLRPSENNGGRQGPLVTARVRKTRESQYLTAWSVQREAEATALCEVGFRPQ